MTDEKMVEVTQADRKAYYNLRAIECSRQSFWAQQEGAWLLSGDADHLPQIQAFARHRIEALTAKADSHMDPTLFWPNIKTTLLREALERIASRAMELRLGTDDWFELVEFELIARHALVALKGEQ